MTDLTLHEWQTCTPADTPALAGESLGGAVARRLAADLAAAERLRVVELRDGLEVQTTSFVGVVQIGDLRLAVQPKLQGLPLLNLVRYAYGLRDLKLLDALPRTPSGAAFHDLLLRQLVEEVGELAARGLHRRYERRQAHLGSPRGRIDLTAFARQAGPSRATLPCTHHPRQEDTALNRAVLGGLRIGVRLTSDLRLRGQLRRLAALLAESVAPTPLTAELLRRVRRLDDRLSAAYRPALAVVELLATGQGTALAAGDEGVPVPGFLFDMNRFFQALLSRYLHQHLADHTVRDEQRLVGMLAYDPRRNPRRRRAPAPRPDFVVHRGGRACAMLDAKYRDLWEQPLPRSMLYQLVIYASSREAGGRAVMLYPTLDPGAEEACVEVRDPLAGAARAEVILRPVDMLRLERLVSGPRTAQQGREAAAHARWLVYGEA